MPDAQERRLFTIDAAAAYLREIGAEGVTAYSVRRLIATGQLPHIRLGKRFHVSRAALDGWLAKNERIAK